MFEIDIIHLESGGDKKAWTAAVSTEFEFIHLWSSCRCHNVELLYAVKVFATVRDRPAYEAFSTLCAGDMSADMGAHAGCYGHRGQIV